MVFHASVGPDGKFNYTIIQIMREYMVLIHLDISCIANASTNKDKLRLIPANEFLAVINGTLVTEGKETNTSFQATLHTFINANEVRANVEHIETKCIGGY